jgi:uncharacterized membrane protein
MCNDIREYLTKLRNELEGSDPATMQDALSDAEEHLTAALAVSGESGEKSDRSETLAAIIEEYGSPSEVAAAYRIIERRMAPRPTVPAQFYERSTASQFFSVVYDPRAWGALLYMLISIITGTLFFSWAIVGLALSIELLILIIGLPVAWLVLRSVRGIALIEGRIVEGLLGVQMPRLPVFLQQNLRWFDQLKLLVRDKRTWATVGYMVMMMPLGTLYFSVAIILFALSLEFMLAPIVQNVIGIPLIMFGKQSIHFGSGILPLFVVAGAMLFVATLHVTRWIGRWHGRLAKAMLVGK